MVYMNDMVTSDIVNKKYEEIFVAIKLIRTKVFFF
jgi:hypothetical protein